MTIPTEAATLLRDLRNLIDFAAQENVHHPDYDLAAAFEAALTKAEAEHPQNSLRGTLVCDDCQSRDFNVYNEGAGILFCRECGQYQKLKLAPPAVPVESLGRDAEPAAKALATMVKQYIERHIAAGQQGAGCGACGDGCKGRGSCRLADESPKPAGAVPDPLDAAIAKGTKAWTGVPDSFVEDLRGEGAGRADAVLENRSEWSLHDRVEFALRDAGFDYDEAFNIASIASATPQMTT